MTYFGYPGTGFPADPTFHYRPGTCPACGKCLTCGSRTYWPVQYPQITNTTEPAPDGGQFVTVEATGG